MIGSPTALTSRLDRFIARAARALPRITVALRDDTGGEQHSATERGLQDISRAVNEDADRHAHDCTRNASGRCPVCEIQRRGIRSAPVAPAPRPHDDERRPSRESDRRTHAEETRPPRTTSPRRDHDPPHRHRDGSPSATSRHRLPRIKTNEGQGARVGTPAVAAAEQPRMCATICGLEIRRGVPQLQLGARLGSLHGSAQDNNNASSPAPGFGALLGGRLTGSASRFSRAERKDHQLGARVASSARRRSARRGSCARAWKKPSMPSRSSSGVSVAKTGRHRRLRSRCHERKRGAIERVLDG